MCFYILGLWASLLILFKNNDIMIDHMSFIQILCGNVCLCVQAKAIATPFGVKKEIVFPPDSVESVQPSLSKRKRITHKDLGKSQTC